MEFYRKAEKILKAWAAMTARKPLLMRGARQVGKSTLVRDFGKQFEIYIELNLERKSDAALFEDSTEIKQLMEAICLVKNKPFQPEKTLLFIDEIQEFPEAIGLLRYFYEDLPQLHVIAAGSLLEFAMGEVSSMPVGRIDIMALHPMDFEEFLMACGENALLQYYKQIPLSPVAYSQAMKLFNRYIMVGGMPSVVQQYEANGKTLAGLQDTYASIWDVYKRDIEKYGKNDTARKVLRHIVQTAPFVKDRITLSGFGESQYRSREVSEAFTALELAGLIRLIYPTTDTSPPGLPDLKRKPRLQFLDTGLLNYAGNLHSEMLMLQDFTDFFRGFIVSHVVTQELIAAAPRTDYKPVFWVREKSTANAEVDLLVQWNGLAVPVEIKSGAEGRLRSLHAYIDSCPHSIAVRLLGNKVQVEKATTLQGKAYTLINLPYCCGAQIPAYLDWVRASGQL